MSPVTTGDTWCKPDGSAPEVFRIRIVTNGVAAAPAAALVHVRIQFKTDPANDTADLELTDADGITVTSLPNWEFEITPRVMDLPAGQYFFDVETEDADGMIKTYLKGKLPVLGDVTR